MLLEVREEAWASAWNDVVKLLTCGETDQLAPDEFHEGGPEEGLHAPTCGVTSMPGAPRAVLGRVACS